MASDSSEPASPLLPAIVIAGTHSGVGKTSVTLGLIGALASRGLAVQPFKVGPDFIDPLHHTQASGRASRNLDGWMLDAHTNLQRFASATADADVAVIEGVMGLFDGSEGRTDRGSTAEIAKLFGSPVTLVVDAGAIARSAAALIHGFVSFDPDLRVAGVILNNIGGEAHAQMIRDAVGGEAPIVGAIPRVPDLAMPERHLGLHLPHEAREDHVERLAALIEAHVDLDGLLAESRIVRPAPPPAVVGTSSSVPFHATAPVAPPSTTALASSGPAVTSAARSAAMTPAHVRIGLARDEAFCFYYPENLELLEQAGAQLVEFSPIRDDLPANLGGLYVGGGYPELHAAELAANERTRHAIRDFCARGGPTYAECGGLMYLGETLELDGVVHPMCGALPFSTRMPASLSIDYVEIETSGGLFGEGHAARGHLFHQSEIVGEAAVDRCYAVRSARGEVADEGYCDGNVLASYIHLHFGSAPQLPVAFVQRCQAFWEAAGR